MSDALNLNHVAILDNISDGWDLMHELVAPGKLTCQNDVNRPVRMVWRRRLWLRKYLGLTA